MNIIIKMCLEEIHTWLKIMTSNLIWHILIKCSELEVTATYIHDEILPAGNTQKYITIKEHTFFFIFKNRCHEALTFLVVPICDLRILKLPPPHMNGNLFHWRNHSFTGLCLGCSFRWADLENMSHYLLLGG